MDAKEQLKDDVRAGRVGVDRLIDLIFTLQERIAERERKLAAASSPTAKVDEPYSMFGREILLQIAFLTYTVGLSFEKVCLLPGFFQNLKMSKTQVDASLHQLSRHWEKEFETLCTLLANSLVVHADETGWSLNSVWAFLSEKARLVFFGVPKDAATLEAVLDPATFKVKGDGRLGDAGRRRKAAGLDDEVLALCLPMWSAELPKLAGPDDDYRRLANEVMRLMLNEELFAFVTAASASQPNGVPVVPGPTNNEAERTLRSPALARKTGRTNKSLSGARRRTIVTSVLESLRLYLKQFTLANVIKEVGSWAEKGCGCFAGLLKRMKLPPPGRSVLDRVYPQPEPQPSG